MTAYRSTRQLSAPEAAYIPGLIDGEGTVAVSRKHAGDNRQPCISISNADRALRDYVRYVTGTGKVAAKYITRPEYAPSFDWEVYNRHVLTVATDCADSELKQHGPIIQAEYVQLQGSRRQRPARITSRR